MIDIDSIIIDRIVEILDALALAIGKQHQSIETLADLLKDAAKADPLDYSALAILQTEADQYIATSKRLTRHVNNLVTPIKTIWQRSKT